MARTSVLAWVGLGFALLGALVTAAQVMIVTREARANIRFSWTNRVENFVLPLLGVLLAASGWRRHRKRWPAVAVGVAVLSILTLLVLGSRTWGRPLPGGESPWHWPQFEWGQR